MTVVAGGERRRGVRLVSEAVHTSRVRTVGSRGRRPGGGGTSGLMKGRPSAGETRTAESSIWRMGVGLAVGTESERRVGEKIVGYVVSTVRVVSNNDVIIAMQ